MRIQGKEKRAREREREREREDNFVPIRFFQKSLDPTRFPASGNSLACAASIYGNSRGRGRRGGRV